MMWTLTYMLFPFLEGKGYAIYLTCRSALVTWSGHRTLLVNGENFVKIKYSSVKFKIKGSDAFSNGNIIFIFFIV